jgi:flagellar protein FliT
MNMGSYQVITHYESLSTLTEQMHEAAMRGEWDHLVDLEQQCRLEVAAIKPLDAVATLDEQARQHKAQLIRKILAHDADIRSRTQAWMEQLQNAMQSNRQEQRLQQAYGG